jgi:hypothetical protein
MQRGNFKKLPSEMINLIITKTDTPTDYLSLLLANSRCSRALSEKDKLCIKLSFLKEHRRRFTDGFEVEYIESSFPNGKKHGKSEGWWILPDGSRHLEHQGQYIDGKRDGVWKWFFSRGNKIITEKTYSMGVRISFVTYFQNGSVCCHRDWNLVTFYSNDGMVVSQKRRIEEHCEKYRSWREGQKFEVGKFIYGARSGVWRKFRQDGTIKNMFLYEWGKKIGRLILKRDPWSDVV